MKILVLMKRFSTNKDLVMQNFGRQVRLFEHLRKSGHKIDFLCMDYKRLESKKVNKNGIDYYIEPFSLAKFNAFLGKLNSMLIENNYDVLVASTSPLLGIIGYYYSRKRKIKMVYDLQDSFDAYDEYKIPFVKQIDKYVTKNADVVICVSHSLRNSVKKFRKKPIFIVENGIEKELFRPMEKTKCRKNLRLPLNKKIIVYIGQIAEIKGFSILIAAFDRVRKKIPNAYLLISGQIDKVDAKHENVIYETLPERMQVAMAINAADVAVIPNPRNDFTEYCFPYKLVEYMACNVPIVATDVGDVSLMLKKYKGSLCKPNDSRDLSEKIIAKIKKYQRVDYAKSIRNFGWGVLAERLDNILQDELKRGAKK